jgi:hypothetical protein
VQQAPAAPAVDGAGVPPEGFMPPPPPGQAPLPEEQQAAAAQVDQVAPEAQPDAGQDDGQKPRKRLADLVP